MNINCCWSIFCIDVVFCQPEVPGPAPGAAEPVPRRQQQGRLLHLRHEAPRPEAADGAGVRARGTRQVYLQCTLQSSHGEQGKERSIIQ